MTNLKACHPSGVFADKQILASRNNLLEAVSFAVDQSIWLLLIPFEASSLAKNTEPQPVFGATGRVGDSHGAACTS